MANPFYGVTGAPVAQSRGTSASIRSEFSLIQSGFDAANSRFATVDATAVANYSALNAAKGSITGQSWTGAHSFAGGITVPTLAYGAAGGTAASVDYVNAAAFAAANLPAQTGNAGKLLATGGATPTWTALLSMGVIRFADSADPTKLAALSLSSLPTATTRTMYMPNRDVVLGGFSNLVVIASTATWTPPAGVTRAEITVQDGGSSGATASNGPSGGGSGGKSSVSVIAVDPAVAYTCAIGAGAAAGTAGTGVASVAGNASSFFGSGITTLTSTTGQINVPGGAALLMPYGGGTSIGSGGASLFCLPTVGAAPTGYGGGGPGVDTGLAGFNGKSGVIIIRY